MAFVKLVKNNAYFKRRQVKPKRRRQGKTDFYARQRLVRQDKNKYDSKKYRLVVRRTNSKFIAQVIYATMQGDKVLCASESTELKRFGVTAGLTNYASAYCTGLLLARRLLKQVGLADIYKTNDKIDGTFYNVDEDIQDDKRPFKALLDVGLAPTTTGARIFGVLKGACDGGVNVPHKTKRFPGYHRSQVEEIKGKRGKVVDSEKTEAKFDEKILAAHIYGDHVTEYMNKLKKEDPAKFKRQFSRWEKCLGAAKAKTCRDLYKKVHAEIVKKPERPKNVGNKKPTKTVVTPGYARVFKDSKGRKWIRHFRQTVADRKERVNNRIAAALSAAQDV